MTEKILYTITPVEKVISSYLFSSDFYHIKNWSFNFKGDTKTSSGFNDCFCIVIVRTGKYLFDFSGMSHDMHTGHVVIEKSNYDYKLRPATGECTIFNFTDDFYRRFISTLDLQQSFFFSNNNIRSVVLNTTPETDYLHYRILNRIKDAGKLEIDNLVLELLKQIVASFTYHVDADLTALKNHLVTIEKAKEYMNENFASDISLQEISVHSCVSPFHFSRIFKKFTSFSPYQYLLNTRLKHSEMLLKNTSIPVTEVSFSSGFNSSSHFATAFKQRYKINPTQYRKV